MFDFANLFYSLFIEMVALLTSPINIHILQYVDSFGLLAPILDAFELNVVVGLVLVNLYASLAVLNLLVAWLLVTLTKSSGNVFTNETNSTNPNATPSIGFASTPVYKTFKTLTVNFKNFISQISRS